MFARAVPGVYIGQSSLRFEGTGYEEDQMVLDGKHLSVMRDEFKGYADNVAKRLSEAGILPFYIVC